MTLYKAPFKFPSPDDIATAHLRDLLQEYDVAIAFNFDAPHDSELNHTITGTLENLQYFMMDVMCEVTREYFDCKAWSDNVKANHSIPRI